MNLFAHRSADYSFYTYVRVPKNNLLKKLMIIKHNLFVKSKYFCLVEITWGKNINFVRDDLLTT